MGNTPCKPPYGFHLLRLMQLLLKLPAFCNINCIFNDLFYPSLFIKDRISMHLEDPIFAIYKMRMEQGYRFQLFLNFLNSAWMIFTVARMILLVGKRIAGTLISEFTKICG